MKSSQRTKKSQRVRPGLLESRLELWISERRNIGIGEGEGVRSRHLFVREERHDHLEALSKGYLGTGPALVEPHHINLLASERHFVFRLGHFGAKGHSTQGLTPARGYRVIRTGYGGKLHERPEQASKAI
jgi:hypothetical protein